MHFRDLLTLRHRLHLNNCQLILAKNLHSVDLLLQIDNLEIHLGNLQRNRPSSIVSGQIQPYHFVFVDFHLVERRFQITDDQLMLLLFSDDGRYESGPLVPLLRRCQQPRQQKLAETFHEINQASQRHVALDSPINVVLHHAIGRVRIVFESYDDRPHVELYQGNQLRRETELIIAYPSWPHRLCTRRHHRWRTYCCRQFSLFIYLYHMVAGVYTLWTSGRPGQGVGVSLDFFGRPGQSKSSKFKSRGSQG